MHKYIIMFGFLSLFFTGVVGVQGQESKGLLLTEVYYDTPGTDGEEEWIEIANLGEFVIDLTNFKVGDEESSGGQEGMVRFPLGAFIEPGEVVVVAQTASGFQALFGRNPDYEINDTDLNVPDMISYVVWAGGELALANKGDELLLVDGQDKGSYKRTD